MTDFVLPDDFDRVEPSTLRLGVRSPGYTFWRGRSSVGIWVEPATTQEEFDAIAGQARWHFAHPLVLR